MLCNMCHSLTVMVIATPSRHRNWFDFEFESVLVNTEFDELPLQS